MNEKMEKKSEQLVKWLRVLMYIAIANIVNSVVNFLPFVPAAVTTWIGRGIMLAVAICMFMLASVNERYKKSGMMRAAVLVCTLVTVFLNGSPVLTLAISILSIIAVYQEYHAHSELLADKDTKLSRKWQSLFTWGVISGILVGFGSTVTVLILSLLEMELVRLTAIIVGILSIPQMILDLVYMLYLKKMVSIFENYEVQ